MNVADWIILFIWKCYEEAKKPGTVVVALIPARTDTRFFHDYIYHKAEIRFIKGRLKFGGCKDAAPFPSMVVIFGKEREHEETEHAGSRGTGKEEAQTQGHRSKNRPYRIRAEHGLF